MRKPTALLSWGEEVQRGREYEERYAAERAAEELQTETLRDDMGKPE